jgi:hypothetical protein
VAKQPSPFAAQAIDAPSSMKVAQSGMANFFMAGLLTGVPVVPA